MSEGMMKGAPPTAPGGMSQKALVEELVAEHKYHQDEAENMRWPEQIDAVILGRKRREAEQAGVGTMFDLPGEGAGTLFIPEGVDFDPDELMAELTSTRDEHEAEVRAYSLFLGNEDTLDYIFNGHAGAGP